MDIFLSILICFLAVYGVFRILYGIAFYFADAEKVKPEFHHKLIAVNNSSENIESFVRAFSLKEEGEKLIILDLSTNSEIKKILELLENDFAFIEVMTRNQYIAYISEQ